MTAMDGVRISISPGESGQILFYLLVVLPLAVSLTVLTVDVSRWQLLRARAQAEADRIVLSAARYLPDTVAASQYIANSLKNRTEFVVREEQRDDPQFKVSSSGVSLVLRSAKRLSFSFLLPGRHKNLELPVQEEAKAQLVPGEYAIVFADADSLAPPVLEAWGSLENWPSANYFRHTSAHAEQLARQRWATQNCFNPFYTPLKQSVGYMLDVLSAVETNRVVVLSSPGDPSAVSEISGFQFLNRIADSRSVIWSRWLDSETLVSDEACTYFSDPDFGSQPMYRLLELPRALMSQATELLRCQKYVLGFPFADHFPSGNLRNCFFAYVPLREAIHYHSVRTQSHHLDGQNIVAAVRAAAGELLYANPLPDLRGTLAARVKKVVFVVSDVLPTVSEELRNLLLKQIRIVFVGYAHPFLDNYDQSLSELRARSAELRAAGFTQVYVADTPTTLQELVLKLLNEEQQVVLQS